MDRGKLFGRRGAVRGYEQNLVAYTRWAEGQADRLAPICVDSTQVVWDAFQALLNRVPRRHAGRGQPLANIRVGDESIVSIYGMSRISGVDRGIPVNVPGEAREFRITYLDTNPGPVLSSRQIAQEDFDLRRPSFRRPGYDEEPNPIEVARAAVQMHRLVGLAAETLPWLAQEAGVVDDPHVALHLSKLAMFHEALLSEPERPPVMPA